MIFLKESFFYLLEQGVRLPVILNNPTNAMRNAKTHVPYVSTLYFLN